METRCDVKTDGFWPLLEQAFDGVVLLAPAPWQVVRVNAFAAECLGATERTLIGRRAVELFDDASRNAAMEQVQRAWIGDSNVDAVTATVIDDAGVTRRVELRASALTLDGERFVGLVFRVAETGDRAVIDGLHRVDPLTGLRDRDFLTARLSMLLRNGQAPGRPFAVLFVDLDNFKAVNDRFGHLVGDRVLREAARRLDDCAGKHDLARYGGDEFVVVMEAASNAGEAEELAARIRAAIAPPIVLAEGEVALAASVGIAWASQEFRTPDDLIVAADRAMYAAKRGK